MAALVVIDVQRAFVARRDRGNPWANPGAEVAIAALLAAFRKRRLPVIHVHHHGTDPEDDFHRDAPGAQVMVCAAPAPGEAVVIKQGSSAFIGTDLAERLAGLGNPPLVIAGGAANYCVNSSARMAGNLGYQVTVASDALINFGQRLGDGRVMPAADVLALTLADLDGEFGRVETSGNIIARL
ncbi:isochorismatase family protein [Fuscibacter oryzae]|uniref:Isochorismatase family protein n=1 Tax=Fuscibacter oryzae TaxID=2803939 RepID=A0A8J7MQY3_9RHOB|nr:isochorismatase family protein [Fuscibacter oryzae]MBL4926693.1 isochorismatase family protein [Fuscibacter oryzae]